MLDHFAVPSKPSTVTSLCMVRTHFGVAARFPSWQTACTVVSTFQKLSSPSKAILSIGCAPLSMGLCKSIASLEGAPLWASALYSYYARSRCMESNPNPVALGTLVKKKCTFADSHLPAKVLVQSFVANNGGKCDLIVQFGETLWRECSTTSLCVGQDVWQLVFATG